MRVVTADVLAGLFTFPELVEQLRRAFRQGVVTPVRHHHKVTLAGEPAATLLLMPAWTDMSTGPTPDAYLGVKIVAVYPGNKARGKPSVAGSYLLMAGATGEPLAVLDGSALTLWRTAAASALAASYLARRDSSRMLMVGAGALAPFLIAAHSSFHPIQDVAIWNRSPDAAERLAANLLGCGFPARACTDLGLRRAPPTSSPAPPCQRSPLCAAPGSSRGRIWIWSAPSRRRCARATTMPSAAPASLSIHVPARSRKAGDVVQPLKAGILAEADICGDLFDLCRGESAGRTSDKEITFFKSVGTALEDLAAAALAYARLTSEPTQPNDPQEARSSAIASSARSAVLPK
jgi:ornithine cyclodeaminase